jgi:hypothetical protein
MLSIFKMKSLSKKFQNRKFKRCTKMSNKELRISSISKKKSNKMLKPLRKKKGRTTVKTSSRWEMTKSLTSLSKLIQMIRSILNSRSPQKSSHQTTLTMETQSHPSKLIGMLSLSKCPTSI